METNLSVELASLAARWDELDVLITTAREYPVDEAAHVSICRSTAVLTCSHFEGAVKAVSKAMVRDVLEQGSFRDLPTEMQMRYTESVLLGSKPIDEGTKKDICKRLCSGYFHPDSIEVCSLFDHDGGVLEKWAKYFGVRQFLNIIKGSGLEEAFEGDTQRTTTMLHYLENLGLNGSSTFPYAFKESDDEHNCSISFNKFDTSQSESMFHLFLENTFNRRHAIAHGVDLTSSVGVKGLEGDILKMKLVLLGYVIAVGQSLSASFSEKNPQSTDFGENTDTEPADAPHSLAHLIA